MKQISLKLLFIQGLFSAISNLRFNTNGYPYLTLIGRNGTANNVYFGQKSADIIGANYAEGDDVSVEFPKTSVVMVKNEAGEQRFKLVLEGESEYSGAAKLADIFGAQQEVIDFDTVAFAKEFTSAEDEQVEEDEQTDENAEEALQPTLKNKAAEKTASAKPATGAAKPATKRAPVVRKKA